MVAKRIPHITAAVANPQLRLMMITLSHPKNILVAINAPIAQKYENPQRRVVPAQTRIAKKSMGHEDVDLD